MMIEDNFLILFLFLVLFLCYFVFLKHLGNFIIKENAHVSITVNTIFSGLFGIFEGKKLIFTF